MRRVQREDRLVDPVRPVHWGVIILVCIGAHEVSLSLPHANVARVFEEHVGGLGNNRDVPDVRVDGAEEQRPLLAAPTECEHGLAFRIDGGIEDAVKAEAVRPRRSEGHKRVQMVQHGREKTDARGKS